MTRKYYAQYCPYGTRTRGGERLFIFETASERDAWVAADECDGGNPHREPITARIAYAEYGKRIKRFNPAIRREKGISKSIRW